MADLRVYPGELAGTIPAPPSKSAAHRALICAALAQDKSRIAPLSASEDMAATAGVLRAMGADITLTDGAAELSGHVWRTDEAIDLDCIESGSTLRFLLPVAAALGLSARFTGRGRLPDRPLGVLTEQLAAHGVQISGERIPFSIRGQLTAGRFTLPGDVSSQFVSGLLFALPLLAGDSEIVLTSPLQSAGYVDMTLASLATAGITVVVTETGWQIPGNQTYRAGNHLVEADWSNAAFWLCAGAMQGDVRLTGLTQRSAQGDRMIHALIERFGGHIAWDGDAITVSSGKLHGIRIDAGPIPDLVPVLAVLASAAQGETEIYNAARLRIKESDRLASVTAMLCALGGQVQEYPDRLVISGGALYGGTVDGMNDHRIVMAAAIAAQVCTEPVTIRGVQAANKSYPDFFEKLKALGGRYDVIDLG